VRQAAGNAATFEFATGDVMWGEMRVYLEIFTMSMFLKKTCKAVERDFGMTTGEPLLVY